MASARVYCPVVAGATGQLLTIEADICPGFPVTLLHRFPRSAWRDQRTRVRTAVISSGYCWPQGEVIITAGPWALPRPGPGADLAMAVAVLGAAGEIPPTRLRSTVFYGGLSPDGQLRAAEDVVPVLQMPFSNQCTTVVIPVANLAQASRAGGIRVMAAADLCQVVRWLRGGPPPPRPSPSPSPVPAGPAGPGLVPETGPELPSLAS